MKKQKKQDGFSLVELIIAIAIMAVIVIPFLRAFAISARTNAKAKAKLRATEASQNIMETIEATSLDDLLTYFTGVAGSSMFGESSRMRLEYDASTNHYATTFSADEASDGNYYFALKDINSKDVLLKINANTSANGNGEVLNEQSIAKITAISSDNDAICTVTKTQADIMPGIYASCVDPDLVPSESSVSRHIDITIADATDPTIGTYTKVTTNHYYTWSGGSYPTLATDGDFSDVVFDNSDDITRQLNNIYLFYYPWYTSSIGNVRDYITINNTSNRAVNVFIIKQKYDIIDSDIANYQMKENSYRVNVNIVESAAGAAATTLRTNFDTNLFTDSALSVSQAVLTLNGGSSDSITQNSLLSEGTENRLFEVTVITYPSGCYDAQFNNLDLLDADDNPFMSITGGMVN